MDKTILLYTILIFFALVFVGVGGYSVYTQARKRIQNLENLVRQAGGTDIHIKRVRGQEPPQPNLQAYFIDKHGQIQTSSLDTFLAPKSHYFWRGSNYHTAIPCYQVDFIDRYGQAQTRYIYLFFARQKEYYLWDESLESVVSTSKEQIISDLSAEIERLRAELDRVKV